MKEIRDIIAEFERRRKEPLALATLVRTRGSSYRRPGARMLVAPDETTVGVLSGGCLEEEVATRALSVIESGVPILLNFDTRRRYGCNGAIEILVERVSPALLDDLAAALRKRNQCVIATTFENAEWLGSILLSQSEQAPHGTFVQTIHPALQLFLIGQGPDSHPLRSFAAALGWDVVETEEATTLPDQLDEWTAAIVKTHNYGRDYAALAKLLPMGLRYLALLGPRLRRDQLLHALHDAGVVRRSELFAPAGFDIGAEAPEEIALAIVTEIQTTFFGSKLESLRARKSPIHLTPDLTPA
jgi:xanthine/CO dehydrogenase XdhC/CoxF family maturation factor